MELRVYDSWILNKFFDPMNQKFVKPSFFMNGFFWNMILLLFISTLQYLTNPYQFTIAYIVFVFLLIFIIKVREFFCLKSSRRSVITLLKLYKLFQKFFFFSKVIIISQEVIFARVISKLFLSQICFNYLYICKNLSEWEV